MGFELLARTGNETYSSTSITAGATGIVLPPMHMADLNRQASALYIATYGHGSAQPRCRGSIAESIVAAVSVTEKAAAETAAAEKVVAAAQQRRRSDVCGGC